MQISQLIKALSDGEFHSGSELGEMLGVSRTAIWKAIDRLDDFDLVCESHRGKGYRLNAPLDLIDLNDVEKDLSSSVAPQVHVNALLQCDSTNVRIHDYTDSPRIPYTFLIAEQQTAGKGRRGRSWVSPFAENIYMSFCFEWHEGVAGLQGLSLVIGISVAELLEDIGVQNVGLKWPNDVWVEGKKVAGILVELEGEVTSSWKVTVGLGLNAHMSDSHGEEIDQPWTALDRFVSVSRTALTKQLIERLVLAVNEFRETGLGNFVERYAHFDALAGKEVVLHGPEALGIVRGINDSGALLLETGAGLEVHQAGEISVRFA